MSVKNSRAFIFSFDAFVAFTLSLVAIYSLIFFSSVPTTHYTLLTQAHYLAKDSLTALSLTKCHDKDLCAPGDTNISILDYVVLRADDTTAKQVVKGFLGRLIPNQFGYKVEKEEGGKWTTIYDTATDQEDAHAKAQKRLSVSSYVVVFNTKTKTPTNPYKYITCNGEQGLVPCTVPYSSQDMPESEIKLVKFTLYA
jgi:hypothetical protein